MRVLYAIFINVTMIRCRVTRGIPLPKEEDRGGHVGGIVENKIIVSGGNRWSEDWQKGLLLLL